MKKLGLIKDLGIVINALVFSTFLPLVISTNFIKNDVLEKSTFNDDFVKTSSCRCNASGVYIDTFDVTAVTGLTWSPSFIAGGASVSSITSTLTGYKFAIQSSFATPYTITLTSSANDHITLTGGNCGVQNSSINGPTSICLSGSGSYTIDGTDTYSFNLSSGGVLLVTGPRSVNVLWSSTPGTYTISATTTNPCLPALTLKVTVGAAYNKPLACVGKFNVSLDSTCNFEAKLSDFAGNMITTGTALALIVKDQNGQIIPNNNLSSIHLGKKLTAHIIDGCSGNECWGEILVEDKLRPTIACATILDVECYKLHNRPEAIVAKDCSGATVYQVGSDQVINLQCDPTYLKMIVRKYVARDPYGNFSDTCSVKLNINRFPLGDIIFPSDKTGLSAIDCATARDTASAKLTGYPSISGIVLNKSTYEDCQISISFKDTYILKPGVTKILRTWEVNEWVCTGTNIRKHTQTIEIKDTQAPVILSCPSDLTITTNAHNCNGSFTIKEISSQQIRDNCSTSFQQSVSINGFGLFQVGQVASLPVGSYIVTHVVTEESGLSDTCLYTLTVKDLTSPAAVCLDSITLSIANKYSHITPTQVNNGSHDACGPLSLKIQRVGDSLFRDTVYFDCSDVGKRVNVILKVEDRSGNINFCMTGVRVEDKIPPRIFAPADLTIKCNELDLRRPWSYYGQAEVDDQCNTVITERIDTLLSNCKVGSIVRRWEARDATMRSTATQTITVVSSGSTIIADSIKGPKDIKLTTSCRRSALHPDSLAKIDPLAGRPKLPTETCSVLGINYVDETYTVAGPSERNCYKVLRKWTVINWCEDNGKVIKIMNQVIAIENKVAPRFTVVGDQNIDATNCTNGRITMTATGTDDCTEASGLQWTWLIRDTLGREVRRGSHQGGVLVFDQSVPTGIYDIEINLNDGCGNYESAQRRVNLSFGKGASFAIADSLAIGLTPVADTAEVACIKAKDLPLSIDHPCGLPTRFSFSATDINDSTKCFDCNDVGYQRVRVYAIDAAGKVTSAAFVMHVQDNNDKDVCSNLGSCIVWPRDTTVISCLANYSPATLRSLPIVSTACGCSNFTVTFSDENINGSATTCRMIRRTHRVSFTCASRSGTYSKVQLITIANGSNPIIECPSVPPLISATSGCAATISIPAPRIVDASCHTGVGFSYRIDNGTITNGLVTNQRFEVGEHTVTYIVTDLCNNSSTCTVGFTVVDGGGPICQVRNVSIFLNAQGNATIGNATIFNNGSRDECNSLPLNFSADRTSFDCSNSGNPVTVNVTVRDGLGNATTCAANVTVIDTVRPTFTLRNITRRLTTAGGSITITKTDLVASASDNCTVSDTVLSQTSFTCQNLGTNVVRVLVRDRSGNSRTQDAIVTIEDGIAPTCRLTTSTVAINGASVVIDSSTINNGSTDACGSIVRFTVSPNRFTCADLGNRRVTATLTDAAGNVTTCETTITIVDGGQLVCNTRDITVFLDQNGSKTITADDVDNNSGTGCGNAVTKSIDRTTFSCSDINQVRNVILSVSRPGNTQISRCTARVTVRDTLRPVLECTDEMITLSCSQYNGVIPNNVPRPRVLGGCNGNFRLDSLIIRLQRSCGLDTLTRTYRLFDSNNNLTSICVQTIMVVNDQPITLQSLTLPPAVVVLPSCTDKSPQATGGSVRLRTGVSQGCSNIGITFSDRYDGPSCTDTLRRVWTVTDSCNSFVPFTYTQRIVANDQQAPVISGVRDTIVTNQGQCGVDLNFMAITVSDCDTRLSIRNNSSFTANRNSANPSGFYPVGVHNVTISATDACGNSSSQSMRIEVRDQVASITCQNITRVIPGSGTLSVSARELVSAFGQICQPGRLKAYFGTSRADTILARTYRCADLNIVNGQRQRIDSVRILVFDTVADTIVHRCIALATISGSQSCASALNVITARIQNPDGMPVPGYEVTTIDEHLSVSKDMTDKEGEVRLKVTRDESSEIMPFKNDDFLNGVNTLDLLQIQRHILGIHAMQSPYQFLAADANGDQKISVMDLGVLRDLILGKTSILENQTSWIAIPDYYVFSNARQALVEEYPRSYHLNKVKADMQLGFVGVKVGDVDQSYTSRINQSDLQNRNRSMIVNLDNRFVKRGELVTLGLKLSELVGGEMSLDLTSLNFIGLENQKWYAHATNNKVKIVGYEKGIESTIIIKLLATKDGLLREMLDISKAVVYNQNLEATNLELEWRSLSNIDENITASPNPWTDQTKLKVISGTSTVGNLTVFDRLGRRVLDRKTSLVAGENEIILQRDDFGAEGIYQIQITIGNKQYNVKTILLR